MRTTMSTIDELTPERAGEVRERLRDEGWRADVAWAKVGVGSAAGAVEAAGGDAPRRTIAYLPSLRAVDGGAGRVWREGDVAAPPEADAREVLVAEGGEWHSDVLELPESRADAAA